MSLFVISNSFVRLCHYTCVCNISEQVLLGEFECNWFLITLWHRSNHVLIIFLSLALSIKWKCPRKYDFFDEKRQ